MAFGDEAWFSDVAWNLAHRFRLANDIFPLTGLESGIGIVSGTFYYFLLSCVFRLAGVGLLQARLLSLLGAGATILILAYRLRGFAWIAVAASPSFLIAAHTGRPEAVGVMLFTAYLIIAISDAWAPMGILGGLSFFISPIGGFWVSGAFLSWLILSAGWKRRLLAAALFALSLLLSLGLTALLGGPRFLPSDIYSNYYIPFLANQNPLFLLKAVIKKTYWFYLIRLKDPVITALFAAAILSAAIRRFRIGREERIVWLSFALGVILSGLAVSRTPDYYFVYLLVPASIAAGLALRQTKAPRSLALFGLFALLGLTKTFWDTGRLPDSDPPSKAASLRDDIPQGAGVVGPVNLWYVLYDKRLIFPLFAELTESKEKFLARMDSLSPGFIVLTDRDTSGWLWEMAQEGRLVRRIPFRGYFMSASPKPIKELLLYRLKPPESETR